MGAAPSAETLRTAPFCPMRKGSRQLALLPFTQEFFPNARSPLFLQLYEAYMDSSVRYYIRREGGSLLQDRIPPIAFTIEELYARYKAVSSSSYYPTNQALREEVEAGRGYRVRPTPCAVVFLYEGKGPEGCARVLKQKSMQIRVIGAVGDALCEPSTTPIVLRESDVFRYQIFITKSAGDHNLVRVQLIAAHVYQYQCLELIGLREVPFLPTTMLTLKTNIPFLCFFRELRGRTHSLWGPSTTLSMWVDDACLRVSASADSMRAICAAFAKHFMIIKEKKSNHRKLRQKGEKDSRKRPLTSSLTEVGSFSSLTDSCEEAGALVPAESSIPFNHAIAMSNKVTYQLKGYIVEKKATIVAGCGAPNEVYVVCTDSVIQVVAPIEGEGKGEGEGEAGGRASVVLTKGVSLTASAIPTKPVVEAGEGNPPFSPPTRPPWRPRKTTKKPPGTRARPPRRLFRSCTSCTPLAAMSSPSPLSKRRKARNRRGRRKRNQGPRRRIPCPSPTPACATTTRPSRLRPFPFPVRAVGGSTRGSSWSASSSPSCGMSASGPARPPRRTPIGSSTPSPTARSIRTPFTSGASAGAGRSSSTAPSRSLRIPSGVGRPRAQAQAE
ncbi:unnamed protein product [Phytomonas sp. EM1]|nr:unnamed protein product [Phytomonas sp. EM1]|eukprot:CCW65621.1 unnamed protein product [Phytomonas sp. isolate EM1]